jgi:hypothetical protein
MVKVKVQKVKLSLSTPRRHTGVVKVQLRSFLTSSIGGGECITSRSCRFTAGKEPRCPLNMRLGRPKSLSGSFGEERILPVLEFESRTVRMIAQFVLRDNC